MDVAWCGTCGTDLHEFLEGPIFIPQCGLDTLIHRNETAVKILVSPSGKGL